VCTSFRLGFYLNLKIPNYKKKRDGDYWRRVYLVEENEGVRHLIRPHRQRSMQMRRQRMPPMTPAMMYVMISLCTSMRTGADAPGASLLQKTKAPMRLPRRSVYEIEVRKEAFWERM